MHVTLKSHWPGFAVILLTFLIPVTVSPYTFDEYGIPKQVIFIGLTGLLLGALLLYHARLSRLPRPVAIMLGFFLCVQFWQMLRQPAPWNAFFGEYGQSESLLVHVGFMCVFLAAFLFLDEQPLLAVFRRILSLTIYWVSLYGLFEYFWGDPISHVDMMRVKSFLGDPNSLGVFLVLTLPVLFWEMMTSSTRFSRFFSGGALLLGTAILLLTFSRAAWLGFILCLAVFAVTVFFYHKEKRLILAAILGLIICGVIMGQFLTRLQIRPHSDYDVKARIKSVVHGQDSGRRFLWSTAKRAFNTSPFWGHGMGSFQDLFHRYESKSAVIFWGPERDLREVHNESLHYLATQGLLGFISYFGLLITLGFAVWPRNAARPSIAFSALAAALLGYMAFVQFAYPLIHYSYLFWLYWGILLTFQATKGTEKEKAETASPRPARLTVICAGVLFGVAVLWGFRIYQADVYYQKAFDAGHEGHYQRSLAYFPKMVALNPWVYQYQYRQALTFIRAARRADHHYISYRSRNYLNQAQAILLNLAACYPRRYQIPFLRGRIAEYLHNYGQARRFYKHAARLFPADYIIWFRLAVTEMWRNHLPAARTAWSHGLKINPSYMKIHWQLEHLPATFFQ